VELVKCVHICTGQRSSAAPLYLKLSSACMATPCRVYVIFQLYVGQSSAQHLIFLQQTYRVTCFISKLSEA